MKLNRIGFYAWCLSDSTIKDNHLHKLIKEFYVTSGGSYGSSWLHQDLREVSEKYSVNRFAKIACMQR